MFGGGSWLGITRAERLFFMYFLTIIQQHLYSICESPLSYQCVCVLYTWSYVHTYGACTSLRSSLPFRSALYFCLHTWYDMYDVFVVHGMSFAVALKVEKASSAQNRGLPTKNICIYIWMLPIKNRGLKTTPGNAWYLVPRLIYCMCMWYPVHNA